MHLRRNEDGRAKVIPLPFLLILKEEIIPGLNSKEMLDQRVEEKDNVTIAIK